MSAIFAPLLRGGSGRAASSRSRTSIASTRSARPTSDLLTTLAASLSVALDNARLIDETRQRAAELAIVNSVGQALAGQLDLDALIAELGDQMRDTFDADLVYVALHDRERRPDRLRLLQRRRRPPATTRRSRFGEGLTSQILQTREPLLLNKDAAVRRAIDASGRRPARTSACRSSPATRRSVSSASRTRPRVAGSAKPTSASWRRSPPTSASRSRTPGCTATPSARRPR